MPRESFLLRTDPRILTALRKWAADDLRSMNGQLDFLLRNALKDAGRFPERSSQQGDADESTSDSGNDA